MKQTYLNVRERILPRFFLLFLFIIFSVHFVTAQEQNQLIQQEKAVKKGEMQPVYPSNEIQLDQVVGRIIKLQELLYQSGLINPNEKLKLALSSLCPDIQLPENGWPNTEQLKKIIASHFDQGEVYLDILLNLHQDLTSKN